MDFGDIRVIPARGLFEKGDMKSPKVFSFDRYQQNYYPSSFLNFVEKSYKTDDLNYLSQIFPESVSDISTISSDICQILSLNGLYIKKDLIFLDHFAILQQIYHKSKPEGNHFTTTELISITNNQNFSFLSENIITELSQLSQNFEKDIVPVFYTNLGFISLKQENINLDNALFAVIISHLQAYFISPTEIITKIPSDTFAEMRSGIPHFPLIKFILIEGKYQPIVQNESFYNYISSSSDIITRLDGMAFPFESIGTRSFPIIGLIGRYSQIKRYLQHFKLKVTVEDFSDTMPFIGIYISDTTSQYIFLYLPDDLPPTHPSFKYVSSFSYSFMRRVCCKVFCLSEQNPINYDDNFMVNGLPSSKTNSNQAKIFGSGKTATILSTEMRLTIDSHGKDFIKFNGTEELLLWKKWLQRLYQFRIFDKNDEKSDTLKISVKHLIMLLRGDSNESISSVFSESKLSKTEEEIIEFFIKDDKQNLTKSVEKQMSKYSQLFTIASRLTQALCDVKKCHCKYCKVPLNQKPKFGTEKWNEMCASCQFSILKVNDNDSNHPTKYLENQVNYAKKQEEIVKSLLKEFSSYFLENKKKVFVKWFYEYYTRICLERITNKTVKEYIEEKFQRKFDDDYDYFKILPEVFSDIPLPLSSIEVSERFVEFYMANIVPHLSEKTTKINPEIFAKKMKNEFERVVNSGTEKNYAIEIGAVSGLPDGTFIVNLEFVNDNKNETFSQDFFLNEIVDEASYMSLFYSRPIYSSLIFTLKSQPRTLEFVNCFKAENKIIVVTKMVTSLWINIVDRGFNGYFLGEPIYQSTIDDKSKVFCDYSLNSNMMTIIFTSQGKRYVKTLYFEDYKKCFVIVERNLESLLPISCLSENDEFKSEVFGLSVSEDGKTGVLSSDYKLTDREFCVIKFIPNLLTAVNREDKFELPFIPIFIDNNGKSIYKSDRETGLKPEGEVIVLPNEITDNRENSFGVVFWRGKPKILVSSKNGQPIINNTDVSQNSVTFSPDDIISLSTDAINNFGIGETDRMIDGGCYCKSVVTIDSVFDLKADKVNSYFHNGVKTANEAFSDTGGLIVTFAHQKPSGNDSINDLLTDPPKGSQIRSIFPFLARMTGFPQFLISCGKPLLSDSNYPSSNFSTSLCQKLRDLPSLPLIRELSQKSVKSKLISFVDCFFDSSSYASSFSSQQFVTSPPGSVRFSTTLVPVSYNRLNKIEKMFCLNCLHWSPHISDSKSAIAISLLHALFSGGLVILVCGREIEEIVDVLISARDSYNTLSYLLKMEIEKSNLIIVYKSRDEENETSIMNDFISSSNNGDSFFNVVSSAVLVPIQNGVLENVRYIADNVQMDELDLEESMKRVLLSAASYGALIDNKDVFLN